MTTFTIPRSTLLAALTVTGRAISQNTTIPICENFLFETGQISASNMSVFITAKCPVECPPVAISGKLLALVKSLPEQPLNFELDAGICRIMSANGKYELPYVDGVDFPKMNERGKKKAIVKGWDRLIEKVLFAASKDGLRPGMCAVSLELGETITATATDSHCLSSHVTGGSGSGVLNIPSDLVKYLTGFEDAELTYNDKNLSISAGDVTVQVILNAEKFPDYKAVLPKDFTKRLTVSISVLSGALRRVLLLGNNLNRVALSCSEAVTISADDADFGQSGLETVSAVYEGEEMVIGFNGTMMLEVLSHCDGEMITLEMSAYNRAIVINQESGLFLLMPMMIGK